MVNCLVPIATVASLWPARKRFFARNKTSADKIPDKNQLLRTVVGARAYHILLVSKYQDRTVPHQRVFYYGLHTGSRSSNLVPTAIFCVRTTGPLPNLLVKRIPPTQDVAPTGARVQPARVGAPRR